MAIPKILKNIFSLTAAEIATKGITFFLFMYLARVLEVDGYGVMSNVASILSYLMMVVILGFSVVGIRGISGHKELTQKYFANITSIKLILAVVGVILLFIYISLSNFSNLTTISLVFGAIQLFAYAIHIDWFFIANEKMDVIAIRQVLVSVITFVGVLIFVKSSADIPLYFLIVSASLLINNLWMLKFADVKIKLECDIPFIKSLLKQSIPIGTIILLISVMSSFGIVYLSQTTTNEQTGLFSAAIKLISFAAIPNVILQNTFASKISQATTIIDRTNIAKQYSTIIFVIGAIIVAEFFVFADVAIYITFGQQFLPATNLFKILAFNSFCFYIAASTTPLLTYWHHERKLLIGYLVSTITLIITTIILTNLYHETGTAIAAIIGDLSLAIILIFFLYKIINKVLILKMFPLLISAFAITVLSRLGVNLLTDNIYFLSIGIVISLLIYFLIIIKFKIIPGVSIHLFLKS